MIKKLILSVALLPCFSFAQCFDGSVITALEGTPIPNATIYIPDQSILTISDSLGKFSLCNVHPGMIIVQITAVDYEPFIKEINWSTDTLKFIARLTSTAILVPEVHIFAHQITLDSETPNAIVSMNLESFSTNGALSLSDGLAKLPGISQLTTGGGISKPVIRGLYGNRIQTVQFGLRFDNQQWQDEHGMGLSTIGIDHVEIIKGAASLLYGSEAMGGVIQLVEEKPAPNGQLKTDFSTQLFTNTYGIANEVGLKATKNAVSWRIRARMENHADYSDGNRDRALNTRFDGYHAKASFGYRGKKWNLQTNYLFSFSNFGFLMDSATEILTADDRLSRSFQLPHHTVYLNVLSSQQSFYFNKSVLKWTLGGQINNRQEQEGGNKISLNMLLNTYSNDLLWIKPFNRKQSISLGIHQDVQTNRNIGSRMIVPDANSFENAIFAYFKSKNTRLAYEGGLRYSHKKISTFETGTINTALDNPGTSILPFSRWYQSLTGALGLSWKVAEKWRLKTNLSSGFRPGNLAELSSNGLHEGSLRYEIGSINLKMEQNLCADISLSYVGQHFSINTTAYANRFFNYIYLNPTGEEYIGFQIFEFIQKNALLKGTEATLEIHPKTMSWLNLRTSYSNVIGSTDEGNSLPFIPAGNIKNSVELKAKKSWKIGIPTLQLTINHCFDQNRPGQFETATPAYTLLDGGIGTQLKLKNKSLTLSLSGQNLLNTTYYTHLSRYKYYGINDRGRSIVLFIKLAF